MMRLKLTTYVRDRDRIIAYYCPYTYIVTNQPNTNWSKTTTTKTRKERKTQLRTNEWLVDAKVRWIIGKK